MSSQKRPGSNWNALQRKISHGKGRKPSVRKASTTSTTTPTAMAATPTKPTTSDETTSLPWFADDLTEEDLAMAMKAPATTATETKHVQAQATQWEGYLDEATKKRVILGDEADMTAEKREAGHYVAIDCEMVGVGPRGSGSALARVSIVNWHGHVLLDRFVRPKELVTDYRTWVSGVRPKDLRNAPSFEQVQAEVAALLKGRVLVGHAIDNDLKALLLSHPRPQIRDTSTFQPLRDLAGTKHPGLRTLTRLVLGVDIQKAGQEHSSVEDARATMAVFRTQKDAWEKMLAQHRAPRKRASSHSLKHARPKSAASWWAEEDAS